MVHAGQWSREEAAATLDSHAELRYNADMTSTFRAVCVGGGCGASQVMRGLKEYTPDITGIIAVTDSGRSTGKVRVAVGVPAPGDIRNALVTLSDGDSVLKDLFQHRFATDKSPDLDGMAFGNLFIAALAQMTGSFERAVQECERLLELRGRILPVTLYDTHLCAELEDGRVVREEVNVRALNKPAIKRVFLSDDPIETSTDCVDGDPERGPHHHRPWQPLHHRHRLSSRQRHRRRHPPLPRHVRLRGEHHHAARPD